MVAFKELEVDLLCSSSGDNIQNQLPEGLSKASSSSVLTVNRAEVYCINS